MAIEERLLRYAGLVDARLRELIPSPEKRPAELHAAMLYSALTPGKRLRPALCMAAAEAVGGSSQHVLDAACAIEMVHAFSLIHDDLPAIDDDELRRGQPTCHVMFGEAVAILAGDALFALGFDTLVGGPWSDAERVRAIKAITSATGSDGLVAGEVTDVLCEGKEVDAETLEFIHSHKTGALIAASCEIGAFLSGGREEDTKNLRAYGELVGLAFQIADDVLNETGTPEQLGKAAGSDREHGKVTYPAMYGIEASRQKALDTAASAQKRLEGLRGDARFLCDLARFSVERLR